jgi:multiple sugar transport system substrate-binding protein
MNMYDIFNEKYKNAERGGHSVKKGLLAMGSLSLVVSLAACGGNNAPASNTGSGESPTKSAEATAGTGNKAKLQVVLGFTKSEVEEQRNNTDPSTDKTNVVMYDALSKEYPDYDFSYEHWGWAEDLDSKQRAAILSGNVPDIIEGETFIPSYAAEGILEPLPEDIVKAVNPSFLVKDNDGKPVAVARSGNIFMLFYNKDLLKQAGLDPETVKLDTWADWKAASDAVTKAGGGKVFGGGIPSHPHAGGSLRMTAVARSVGAEFGSEGKPTIDTPQNIEALQFVRDMDANFPKGIGNNPDEGPLYTSFEKNKSLAFVVNGTWQAKGAASNGINYGVKPLPVGPNGKPANTLVGFVYYAVPKASKSKEAAFNVLRTIVSKEVQLQIAGNGQLAANQEVQNDAANVYKDFPVIIDAVKQFQESVFTGLPAFSKNNAQIWEIINSSVIARTTMTKDPIETIVKQAQAEADKLIK